MKRKLPNLNPRSPRKRPLTDEELALWREEVKEAAPVVSSPRRGEAGRVRRSFSEGGRGASLRKTEDRKLSHTRTDSAPSRNAPSRNTPSLPLPLRGREKTPEARLDLHGMTEAEAHAALLRFIERSKEQGKRTLLVITGRGKILREALPRWLHHPALHPKILTCEPAPPALGGAGAFLLTLRRRG